MRGIPARTNPSASTCSTVITPSCQDRVRTSKQTGLGHLPSASWRVNTAWTQLAAIAADLDVWTRLLGSGDHEIYA
jgi:hypothetical protein